MARAGLWTALLLAASGPALVEGQMNDSSLASLALSTGCLVNVTGEAESYMSCVAAAGSDVHQQCGCLKTFEGSHSVGFCRDHPSTSLQIKAVTHMAAKCRGVASDLTCMQEVTRATANYPRCMTEAGTDQEQQCGCMDLLNESLTHCMDAPSATDSINQIVGTTRPQCAEMASNLGCARLTGSAAYRYPVCYNDAAGDQYLQCSCLEEVNLTLGNCIERGDIQSHVQQFLGNSNADCGGFTCVNKVGEALINYQTCMEGLTSTGTPGSADGLGCSCKSTFESEAGACASHPNVQAQVAEVLRGNRCGRARPVVAQDATPATTRHDEASDTSDLKIALLVCLVICVAVLLMCIWCLLCTTPEKRRQRRKVFAELDQSCGLLEPPDEEELVKGNEAPPAGSGSHPPGAVPVSLKPSHSELSLTSSQVPLNPSGRDPSQQGVPPAAVFAGAGLHATPVPPPVPQSYTPVQQGYATPVPPGYGPPMPQGYATPVPQSYGPPMPQGYPGYRAPAEGPRIVPM